MVFTGTNRSRPTSMVRAPSNTSIAAPMAVSIWITFGVDGSAGSRFLTLRISGQAEDPAAGVEGLDHRLHVEPQVVGGGELVAVEVGQRLPVRLEGLRGLAQHDPAVVLAAGEVATLAVRRRTSHGLDRERRAALGEPARDPRVGDGAEVVGVGDEDVAVAGVEEPRQQAGAAQRGVDVAVPGRTPLEVGRLGVGRRQQVGGEELGLLVLQELQRQAVDRQVRRSGPGPPWCRPRCGRSS